ncbi:MAG TPA: cache domain-containing protein [Noviherbaspirillum sp.]|nr:cache domain-containing protein [Noviherbaspirillum sp.]
MRNLFLKVVLSILSVALVPAVSAQDKRATPDEAVALVKKGVEYYKKHGKEKALAAFNDPNGEFVKGELYFFVYGTNGDGVVLAHGQNPKMVGKHLIDMKDVDGVHIIKEATKIANSKPGNGWLEYKWPNSVTKAVEPKKSYIERVDDIWIGCGVYRP